jgi:hypothetical protein
MIIKTKDGDFQFQEIQIKIQKRNIKNIFTNNKKTLGYKLHKALNNKKDSLYKIAEFQLKKYEQYLDQNFGEFLKQLKENNNDDYKLYLNKYGDLSYCEFKLNQFTNDKGLYCYIIENRVIYIGRSKKTFKERINEYGRITPYNCLIDGQATNCKVNSKINNLNQEIITMGFLIMNEFSDTEISTLEKKIIKFLNENGEDLWNSQLN